MTTIALLPEQSPTYLVYGAMERDDESSDADKGETIGSGTYVTELGPHDVLLGRGTGPSNNQGNVNFRIAVEDMKSAYVSTPSRKAKNRLVRKTVNAIKAHDGRFLSKLRKSEIKMLGLHQKVAYEIVSDSVAVEKTKQAIRYVHYKKDAHLRIKDTEPEEKKEFRISAVDEAQSEQDLRKQPAAPASVKPSDPLIADSLIASDAKKGERAGLRSQLDTTRIALLPNHQAANSASASLSQRHFSPQLASNLPSLSMQLASSQLFHGSANPLLSRPFFPVRNPTSVPAGLLDFPSQTAQNLPPFFPLQSTSQPFARAGNPVSNLTEQAALAGTAEQFQARLQSNSRLPSSGGVADIFLRSRHLLPEHSSTSAQDERLLASLQQEKLQAALQDEQLRAVILADDRYRRLLGSYPHLMQPPR